MNKDSKNKHSGVRLNKQLMDGEELMMFTFHGEVVDVKGEQNGDEVDNQVILYIDMKSRALMVEGNNMVSSTDKVKNVAEVFNEYSEDECPIKLIMTMQNGDRKVAHLAGDVQVVKKNKKSVLKMIITSDSLYASGRTANNAVDLEPNEFEEGQTIAFYCHLEMCG